MATNIITLCGYGILTLQQHAGCHGNDITIHNDVCLITLPVLDDTAHGKIGEYISRFSIYSLISPHTPTPTHPQIHTHHTIHPHIPKESLCSSHGQVIGC